MKKTVFILILLSSPAMAGQSIDLAYSSNDYGNVTPLPPVVSSTPAPPPEASVVPASALQQQPPRPAKQNDPHKTDMTLSDFF
ncbi:MAG: hypothetical protein WDN72_00340 [Alphaproteobacteria bacterium]